MGALREIARRAAAVAVAGLVAALAGCSEDARRPNLLLVVIDTLRADHVGAYGYERPTTPALDRLAREGTLFERAFSSSSWTKPAVASLFTSRPPSQHGAVTVQDHLRGDVPTLAEQLRGAGYRTVGVSGNFVHVTRTTGMARGFELWRVPRVRTDDPSDTLWTDEPGEGGPVRWRAVRAPELNRSALSLLPEPDGRPLFLYVHYMDPHTSYRPPEALRAVFARDPAAHAAGPPATSDYVTELARGEARADAAERRRLVDLYDAEIAAVDAGVADLVEALRGRGYGEPLLVAVVSDHGEEFGEHGSWFHGIQLHAESLAVPLLLWDSRGPPAASRRREAVDLLDVPTTLLAAAGVSPAEGMQGRDLRAARLTERVLVAELHPDPPVERKVGARDQWVAALDWPWKAILGKSGAVLRYRLDRDAGERSPLAEGGAGVLEAARSALAARSQPGSEPLEPLDPDQAEALRALGYVD